MKNFTVGLPFAGIDGIGQGFEQAGFKVRWHIEVDEFRRKVLALRYPRSYIGKDVHEENASTLCPVTAMAGGFPCTPVSGAGKRKGTADERWLWPEFARLIGELRPRVVFLENADEICAPIRDGSGNITAPAPALGIIADLTALGYVSRWGIVPASAAGSPHERKRWWCVAYTDRFGQRAAPGTGKYSADQQRQPALSRAERSAKFYAAQPGYPGVAQGDTHSPRLAVRQSQSNDAGAQRAATQRTVAGLRRAESARLERQAVPFMERSAVVAKRPEHEQVRQAYVADLGRVVFDGLSSRLERSARTQLYAAPLGLRPYPYEPDRFTDDTTDWQARVEAIGDSVCVPVVRAFAEGIYEWLATQETEGQETAS